MPIHVYVHVSVYHSLHHSICRLQATMMPACTNRHMPGWAKSFASSKIYRLRLRLRHTWNIHRFRRSWCCRKKAETDQSLCPGAHQSAVAVTVALAESWKGAIMSGSKTSKLPEPSECQKCNVGPHPTMQTLVSLFFSHIFIEHVWLENRFGWWLTPKTRKNAWAIPLRTKHQVSMF